MVTTLKDGVIAPPKIEPVRFGLFSAANVVNHGADDEHWLLGFDYESEACRFQGAIRDLCDPEPIDYVFQHLDDAAGFLTYKPFTIEAIDQCSTFGFKAIDRRQRVMRELEVITQKSVEQELWTGSFAQDLGYDNRFLAGDAATSISGSDPVPVQLAVAMLEDAFAACSPGIQPTLHMTRGVATLLSQYLRQVPADPNRLETMVGSVIAAGTGYTGSDPEGDDPDAGVSWMYITGPVTVHLGPAELINPQSAQATDIHVNDLIYQAERPAAVTWDGCCAYAIDVDLTAA